jgi:CubicO group peptidase (beta-lactamase class C family)
MQARFSRLAIAGILLALISVSPKAQASTCSELKAQMESSHIPDIAIAFLDHGHLQTHYYSASGTALSPDAVFEAASLSKPVFAAAVLTLVQQKKLDLDRPLAGIGSWRSISNR